MSKFKVKDVSLSSQGEDSIGLAESRMSTLLKIKRRFEIEKPLKGIVM